MQYVQLHFNWYAYFTLMALSFTLYWVMAIAVLYGKQIKSFIHRLQRKNIHTPEMNFDRPSKVGDTGTRQTRLFVAEDEGRDGFMRPEDLVSTASPVKNDVLIDDDSEPYDALLSAAQSLSEEIRAFVQKAKRTEMVREEVVQVLRSLVRQEMYTAVNNSVFKASVNHLIAAELESQCEMHLGAAELMLLWEN